MSTKSLEDLPDFTTLQQLARALWREADTRGAAVFVGSGFSRNADRISEDAPKAPLWAELTRDLAIELYGAAKHPQAQVDPLRLAEEYRTYFGQAKLDEFVRIHVRDDVWRPGELHRSLLELPWSDVLTTNWDTLLERTAELVAGRAYEPVRAMADMAHARSPRIVKLHGSIGTSQHFVFAEEDYRTYSRRYAAFVNLARQVFLESELCLVGFSGDDPNFLQWSGWVRDHLGGSARRIYLVGDLGLSPPKRRLLESRNVAPIDFAPFVQHLDHDRRSSEAVAIFLSFLHRSKPKRAHEWTPAYAPAKAASYDVAADLRKQHSNPEYIAELIENASTSWRSDRQSYPHWMVCPAAERRSIIYGTSLPPTISDAAIAALEPTRRGQLLYELAWRHNTSFWPLDLKLLKYLVEIIESNQDCGLTRDQHLEIVVWAMSAARELDDSVLFEKCKTVLESDMSDTSFRAHATYQQLLYWRDSLDYQNLHAGLVSFQPPDPTWNLRLAALHCECTDFQVAIRLIDEAFLELRTRQWKDRQSLWVRSRRAWTQWIRTAARISSIQHNDEEVWPSEFRDARCDPWDELDKLKREAAEILRERYEERSTIVPAFEAGSYRDRSTTIHVKNFPEFNVFNTLNYLVDHVGIPVRLDHVNLIGDLMSDAAEIGFKPTLRWYSFLLRAVASHSSPLIERYFARTSVAQMTPELVEALSERVRLSISFWRRKAGSARLSGDFNGLATERLRLLIEVLARLAPRQTIDQAVQGITFAAELATEAKNIHPWLYEPIGRLADESVAAAGSGKRLDLTLAILKFPFSDGTQPIPFRWPNPILSLSNDKTGLIQDKNGIDWTQEVRSLIERVSSPNNNRAEAALRLVYLASINRLNEDEIRDFGCALWAEVDDGQPPLPARSDLLPHVFMNIPAPEKFDAELAIRSRLFHSNLKPDDTSRLHEIAAAATAITNGFGILPTRWEAVRMFDEIVAWGSDVLEPGKHQAFDQGSGQRIRECIGQVVAFALVPQFHPDDFIDERVKFLFQPTKLSSFYDQLPALPYLARAGNAYQAKVVFDMRRSLVKAGFNEMVSVAHTVSVWLKLAEAGELPALPQEIKERILSGVEATLSASQPLLWCSRKIVEAGLATQGELIRLKETIGDLLSVITYDRVDREGFVAVSVSLIRAECVRLAHALKLVGLEGPEIDGWLLTAKSDPLPEVRFALDMAG